MNLRPPRALAQVGARPQAAVGPPASDGWEPSPDPATTSAAPADAPPTDAPPASPPSRPTGRTGVFASGQFLRLWTAMVGSSVGDWLGFFAITALAERVGGLSSVGAVFAARIVPGLLFASWAGAVIDRWDRRRVMVVCDLGRAAVLVSLPFVGSLLGLVVASLVLELLTLAWQPAKEASVPHLVPKDRLTTANSLSVVAAYATFPLAAGLFALLAKAADELRTVGLVDTLRLNQEGLSFYVDAATFLLSAAVIWTLTLPRRPRPSASVSGDGAERPRAAVASLAVDVREGWRFLVASPEVRAVNIGLATGLIGGGMLIPLGKTFITEVLGAGNAGFGLFLFVLGLGMAAGVVVVSVGQKRLPKSRVFTAAVATAGVCLFGATSTTSLTPAVLLIGGLGVCAGTAYVLGFTLLHENVTDEFRGRIFSTLNTLVRLCLLVAMVGGPFLATLLDGVSRQVLGPDRKISLFGLETFVPGIRLTMWLAASIMLVAGGLAARTLAVGRRQAHRSADPAPSPEVESTRS